jgi:predicted Fe-Mo cluster-binding NifX family protein
LPVVDANEDDDCKLLGLRWSEVLLDSSLLDVGILTAKSLTKNRVVETVVTGHCGPKAFKELQEAGVKVFLNARGSLRHVLNKLRLGELQEASAANVPLFGGHER